MRNWVPHDFQIFKLRSGRLGCTSIIFSSGWVYLEFWYHDPFWYFFIVPFWYFLAQVPNLSQKCAWSSRFCARSPFQISSGQDWVRDQQSVCILMCNRRILDKMCINNSCIELNVYICIYKCILCLVSHYCFCYCSNITVIISSISIIILILILFMHTHTSHTHTYIYTRLVVSLTRATLPKLVPTGFPRFFFYFWYWYLWMFFWEGGKIKTWCSIVVTQSLSFWVFCGLKPVYLRLSGKLCVFVILRWPKIGQCFERCPVCFGFPSASFRLTFSMRFRDLSGGAAWAALRVFWCLWREISAWREIRFFCMSAVPAVMA